MVSRRTFLSLVAGSMSAPPVAFAQPETRKIALYANVGADLTHYDVDVSGAALTKRATVTLPAGDGGALGQRGTRDVDVVMREIGPDVGVKRDLARLRLGERDWRCAHATRDQ